MKKNFFKTKFECNVPYFKGEGGKTCRQISKIGRFHHVAKNIP
jgi:hypothetical protein